MTKTIIKSRKSLRAGQIRTTMLEFLVVECYKKGRGVVCDIFTSLGPSFLFDLKLTTCDKSNKKFWIISKYIFLGLSAFDYGLYTCIESVKKNLYKNQDLSDPTGINNKRSERFLSPNIIPQVVVFSWAEAYHMGIKS